jgi:hypothetical protein
VVEATEEDEDVREREDGLDDGTSRCRFFESADAGDPGRGERTEGFVEFDFESRGRGEVDLSSCAFIDLASAKAPLEGSSSLNRAARFLAAFSSRVNPTGSVSFAFPLDFDFEDDEEEFFDFVAFLSRSV